MNEGEADIGEDGISQAASSFLEHLQFLIQYLVQSKHPNTTRNVLQRAGQIDEAIKRCKDDHLPGRREPIVPRLTSVGDADSELNESVVITSSESEEEPAGEASASSRPPGVWQFGRYNSVRVTRNNPLLRNSSSGPTPSSSSSTTRALPPLVLPRGVEIEPKPSTRVAAQHALSIDWHQVLDVVRLEDLTLRPRGYYLLDEIVEKLQALKQVFPDLVICVNSYCHNLEYRLAVLAGPDTIVDFRIVTSKRDKTGGKLDALRAIFGSEAGIVQIDDNFEIVKEISEARNCKALGILIPRRGRKYPQKRFAGAQYFRSVLHALDSLIQGF